MLEDGSLQVDLPFAIPLLEQVVDELIVPFSLGQTDIMVIVVEEIFDVIRQVFPVLKKHLFDMLLLRPAHFAELHKFVRSFCIWVGHFQSAMIVDGAKLLMKTTLPLKTMFLHTHS